MRTAPYMLRVRVTRSCSQSSVGTIDTDASVVPDPFTVIDDPNKERRTRRRFTNNQLMLLEQLYHKTPHPTREQRDALARQNDMDTRSVTVWFQNKRQTDRRHATAASRRGASSSASPFTHAPGKTIHTTHPSVSSATATPSSDTDDLSHSEVSSTADSRKRRGASTDADTDLNHVPCFLSLDRVAARCERPLPVAPQTPPRRTTPSLFMHSPPRRLWETMPSSPMGLMPDPWEDYSAFALLERRGGTSSGRGRERTSLKRMRTLEWACAKERAIGQMQVDMTERGEDLLALDLGGDTDTETEGEVHEAVTPKQGQCIRGGIGADKTSSEDTLVDGDKENQPYRSETKSRGDMSMDTPSVHDEEMMDAALALCGLGARL